MKRFLSWLTLFGCFVAFYYVQLLFWMLFLLIYNAIYNLSEVLFWVLVVLESGTALSIIGAGIFGLSGLSIKASQAVYKSRSGARYIAFGVFYILVYALALIMQLSGVASVANGFYGIAACITMIIFSISIIIVGKSQVSEDGAPPTEKERLQRKLDKINEAERREDAIKALQQAEKNGVDINQIVSGQYRDENR